MLPTESYPSNPPSSSSSPPHPGALPDVFFPMESTKHTQPSTRLAVMVSIFFVSLFAVSFPAVSKRVRYLHIPPILFFIGRHFGTGVILSTAFVHLLQDAFDRLQDPQVKKYTDIGRWTGLIVLSSLLVIFFIEYISTAYVDNLQSYASQPPTPKFKPVPSPSSPPVSPTRQVIDEVTPLLDPHPSEFNARSRRHSINSVHTHGLMLGHHRHELPQQHEEHYSDHPRHALLQLFGPEDREEEEVEEDAATAKPAPATDHHVAQHHRPSQHHHSHSHHHSDVECLLDSADSDGETDPTSDDEAELKIGRKRQIIGILVLQLGIMLHSLVIGFTLALASGSDFESLVTAISFHQLFEGLSLGIRIAALPPPAPTDNNKPSSGLGFGWLRPLLALLFALTTPAGILSGLVVFGDGGSSSSNSSGGHHKHQGGGAGGVVTGPGAKIAEGVLCAISAGMLIYAACVEMLAADIVLDPTLWRSSRGRQVVALASVALGAAGMVLLE
ncbi:ZIP zinc transporter-domain-containing protein [Russula compacta]|nr:ZIP zinc transporter-domain-containing protein [Russula compacta]